MSTTALPTPAQLRAAPELAALAILDAALITAEEALLAHHPDLGDLDGLARRGDGLGGGLLRTGFHQPWKRLASLDVGMSSGSAGSGAPQATTATPPRTCSPAIINSARTFLPISRSVAP